MKTRKETTKNNNTKKNVHTHDDTQYIDHRIETPRANFKNVMVLYADSTR